MAGKCAVRLLGGFAVEIDGRQLPAAAWRHRRGADLVKLLALAPGHRLHREQVEDTFWSELPREAASANLRKATDFARRALGGEEAITVAGGMVALSPAAELQVDAEVFERAARVSIGSGSEAGAIDLYRGDLLPEDRYAEWTEAHRERLRGLYLHLLRRAARWEQILEVDRADEQAHQALMRGFLKAGDRRAAIRQFARLREILRVDLGVGPSAETVSLFEQAAGMEGNATPLPEERIHSLIARALLSWNRQQLEEAEKSAEKARELAADYGLGRELGEASTVLGLVARARGNWPDLFRLESSEVFRREPGQASFVLDGHLCFAEAALYSEDAAEVAAIARELLGLAEASGSLHGQAVMNMLLGETELFSGHLAVAETRLTRAMALFEAAAGVSGQAFALVRLAETAIAAGSPESAQLLLEKARHIGERSELGAHLLPRVFAQRIRAASGRRRPFRIVQEAERVLPQGRICGPCSIGYWLAAAVACTRARELSKGGTCLREAERLAGMWQGGPWLAATWEARAGLRLAEGEKSQAVALLREAADLFSQASRPLDATRCLDAARAFSGQTAVTSR